MSFSVSNSQDQVTLAIGTLSNTQPVTWTSNSDTEGSISATTFTLGTLQYSFQRITITSLTFQGQTILVAHVADATVASGNGPGNHVFFTGLPNVASAINPPSGGYVDTSTPSLFTLTITNENSVSNASLVLANGWNLVSLDWQPPTVQWPPAIVIQINNSPTTPMTTKTYVGVVTAQYDHNAQHISYQFGGTVSTVGGALGDDGDWTSSSNTIPIPATAARYA